MSANKQKPHVLVLPEDDEDRQLARGFALGASVTRQIEVLNPAGGWLKVVQSFQKDHVKKMDEVPTRFIVLLIDFDEQPDRLERVKRDIPDRLLDRVFVLGVWNEPKDLKVERRNATCESIGLQLALECQEETDDLWSHPHLRHNAAEVARMRDHIRPILFPA